MHGSLAAIIRPVYLTLLLILLAGCSLFSRGKPQGIANDTTLQAEVQTALSREPTLTGAQINVHSTDGVVELSGSVRSTAMKSRAGLVAASVRGVIQVHNDLLVQASGK
jgi:hyperosmotically inducible periplasmic protein